MNDGGAPQASLDELLESVVERVIMRVLGPVLQRMQHPEPLVYTVNQAAGVLQVSPDTIGRMIRRGTLPKVPHLDGRVLIPRVAVEALVERDAG